MPITAQQLLQILPNAGTKAGVFAPVLNTAMQRHQIVGSMRVTAFIAQIDHESWQLRHVREIGGRHRSKLGTRGGRTCATPWLATALSIAAVD